jgi:cytochrome P450
MHAATMNIREVLEPTTLEADRTWKLEKGAICTIPSVLLHRNPDIHPHPEEFRIQRFLPTELGGDGSDPKKGLRPFGGGASYCPGRIFAEKQIMSTLANFVMRYEMRITDKKWKYPANADPETVVAHPDIHIEISLRKDWIRN